MIAMCSPRLMNLTSHLQWWSSCKVIWVNRMAVSLNPFEQRLVNFPNLKSNLLFKRFVLEKKSVLIRYLKSRAFLCPKNLVELVLFKVKRTLGSDANILIVSTNITPFLCFI